MPDLVALALPGGPAFVDALRKVWDGGDAAFPLDLRLPPAARDRVMAALAPARVIEAPRDTHPPTRAPPPPPPGGRPVEPGDAVVVATSGTTGQPRGAVLTHQALAASAHATSQRIGVEAGDHWLACLPLAHVGGLSVVTRALATRLPVTVLPGPDRSGVEAAVRKGATLVSLVPTLLARLDPTWFRVIVLGG